MKRFFALLCLLVFLPVLSLADLPDISGLSFDELVELRGSIDLAIWNSKEWQQVKVPAGTYAVGTDIPAGHWTIRAPEGDAVNLEYFLHLDSTGKMPDPNVYDDFFAVLLADPEGYMASVSDSYQTDLDLRPGWYIRLSMGDYAIFEPYTSKPAFTFN